MKHSSSFANGSTFWTTAKRHEGRAYRSGARRSLPYRQFINRDGPVRAKTFVNELYDRCRRLGGMPKAFPLLPGREHSGIRRRPYGNYLIFYWINGDTVEILHVLNGAQDYERVLFPDD